MPPCAGCLHCRASRGTRSLMEGAKTRWLVASLGVFAICTAGSADNTPGSAIDYIVPAVFSQKSSCTCTPLARCMMIRPCASLCMCVHQPRNSIVCVVEVSHCASRVGTAQCVRTHNASTTDRYMACMYACAMCREVSVFTTSCNGNLQGDTLLVNPASPASASTDVGDFSLTWDTSVYTFVADTEYFFSVAAAVSHVRRPTKNCSLSTHDKTTH